MSHPDEWADTGPLEQAGTRWLEAHASGKGRERAELDLEHAMREYRRAERRARRRDPRGEGSKLAAR